MTNENPQNQNTLKSWATGTLAMSLIGLAVGIFLHESGVLQKITSKVFSKTKKESE